MDFPEVFTVLGLKEGGSKDVDDYSYEKFRDMFKYKYDAIKKFEPYAHNVAIDTQGFEFSTISRLALALRSFSRTMVENSFESRRGKIVGIVKVIHGFFMATSGVSHLFCGVLSSSSYSAFYDGAVSTFVAQQIVLDRKTNPDVPYVLIIAKDEENAQRCCRDVGECVVREKCFRAPKLVHFTNETKQESSMNNNYYFDTWHILDEELVKKGADILILKRFSMLSAIEKLVKFNPSFFQSLRFIIIEDADSTTSVCVNILKNVINEKRQFCSFLFLANATKSFRSFLPDLSGLFSKKLHIELEPLVKNNKIHRVRIHRIPKTCENIIDKECYRFQILDYILRRIDESNETRERKKKVVIVTSSDFDTNYIMAIMIQNDRRGVFKIERTDLLADVEEINFQMTFSDNHNIIIVDYMCLQHVQKGLIDQVIFMSLPPRDVIGAILEVQLPKLVARDFVKLRVDIIIDESTHEQYAGIFMQFMAKFNQQIPKYLIEMASEPGT